MMYKLGTYCILFIIFITSSGFVVYDPTNWEQNVITAKNSLELIKKQVDLIHLQVQSMRSLKHYHYRDVTELLKRIDLLSREGRSISYALENVSKQFDTIYPTFDGQEELNNYNKQLDNQNKTTLNTIKNSLTTIAEVSRALGKEGELLKHMNEQSQSSQGQKQVVQVTNELLSESIQQIQLLRKLISVQANSQSAYMAQQVSKASHEEKTLDTLDRQLSEYDVEIESKGFGLIGAR